MCWGGGTWLASSSHESRLQHLVPVLCTQLQCWSVPFRLCFTSLDFSSIDLLIMLVRVCVFVDSSLGRGYVCSVLWLIWVPQAEMDERKCSFPDCIRCDL